LWHDGQDEGLMEGGQGDFGFFENDRRRRGVYLLPGAFTVGNLLCGFYAVLATLQGTAVQMDYAARAIGFAILFDAFDGFVARMTRTNTEFGKQFDSLADMVSFGIAPAVLAFAWGVQVMMQGDGVEGRHVHQLAWLVCLAFAICCAWRLARFNVHGMAPGGLRYFVGMPTPAAAGMIAATVHAAGDPITDWRWSLVWLALVLAVAALMVSSIRYPSFKDLPWARRQHSLAYVVGALLVGSIIKYSEVMLILIAGTYMLTGLTLHVVRMVRHRLVSRTA
jgi:CDP-diacylglycerol---serine O-phosphatidyltransferase